MSTLITANNLFSNNNSSKSKYLNILKFTPKIQEFINKLNERCSNTFTLTYEPGSVYSTGFKTDKNKIIKKKFNNRGLNKSIYSSWLFRTKNNQLRNNKLSQIALLCLNKKIKKRGAYERECISSIQTTMNYNEEQNSLKIYISSKTNYVYEGKKYNKLLRLLIILIYYYLFTNKSNEMNIYIESTAANPISAFLLLQMGFKIITIDGNINYDLTKKLSILSVDELKQFLIDNDGFVNLQYPIHEMTSDDLTRIKEQITDLIVGKSPNNNKSLKCLSNNNNIRKKTLKKNNTLIPEFLFENNKPGKNKAENNNNTS